MKKQGFHVLTAICLLAFLIAGCGENVDEASRKRMENASDEELDMVIGEKPEEDSDVSSVSDQGLSLEPTTIEESGNNPVSIEVDAVKTLVIPEAITIDEGDESFFYGNEDFKDVLPVDAVTFNKTDIPAKYDSRDVGGKSYVPAIEDQGYSYLCWTYACLGAIECDLLKHNESLKAEDIDLSEKHLAYYNVHRSSGSVNGYIDDDFRELQDPGEGENWIFDYDTNYVAVGGVTDYCISLLSSWKGPVFEKESDSFKSLYGQEYLFKDNKDVPSDAYDSVFHVQDVMEFTATEENRDLIKQMIMEHGGVTIGVNADDEYWYNRHRTLYSSFEEDAPTANHEVMIIGWDDDFPASEFRTDPGHDGAWLCRNSWGTTQGYEGYFYLSYYDETAEGSNAAAYSSAVPGSKGWYDHNYQTAGFLTKVVSTLKDYLNTVTAFTASRNPYAVMYKAAGDETLKAVGLMSLETFQQYYLEVYENPKTEGDRILFDDLGEPLLSQKISAVSGGYHTFPLEKDIDIQKDNEFLIIVKPVTEGRLVYESSMDELSEVNYDEWKNVTGAFRNNYSASKRSYYISDDGLGIEVQSDKDFFVKAYTVD